MVFRFMERVLVTVSATDVAICSVIIPIAADVSVESSAICMVPALELTGAGAVGMDVSVDVGVGVDTALLCMLVRSWVVSEDGETALDTLLVDTVTNWGKVVGIVVNRVEPDGTVPVEVCAVVDEISIDCETTEVVDCIGDVAVDIPAIVDVAVNIEVVATDNKLLAVEVEI